MRNGCFYSRYDNSVNEKLLGKSISLIWDTYRVWGIPLPLSVLLHVGWYQSNLSLSLYNVHRWRDFKEYRKTLRLGAFVMSWLGRSWPSPGTRRCRTAEPRTSTSGPLEKKDWIESRVSDLERDGIRYTAWKVSYLGATFEIAGPGAERQFWGLGSPDP